MSVLRVITRIIPLDGNEASFQPASIDALTEGTNNEVEVFYVRDDSGMNYRIERVKEIHNVGPGETTESVNQAFAERLENIPGFVQLNENDRQENPFDRSLQLSVPEVISVEDGDVSSDAISDSLGLSVVDNTDFNKLVSDNNTEDFDDDDDDDNDDDDDDETSLEISFLVPRYPCNATKYKQKYRWRNRRQPVRRSHRVRLTRNEISNSWEQLYETSNESCQESDVEDDQKPGPSSMDDQKPDPSSMDDQEVGPDAKVDHEASIDARDDQESLGGKEAVTRIQMEESKTVSECFDSFDDLESNNNSDEIEDENIYPLSNFTSDTDVNDIVINGKAAMESYLTNQEIDISDNYDKSSSSSSTEVDTTCGDNNASEDDQCCSQPATDNAVTACIPNNDVASIPSNAIAASVLSNGACAGVTAADAASNDSDGAADGGSDDAADGGSDDAADGGSDGAVGGGSDGAVANIPSNTISTRFDVSINHPLYDCLELLKKYFINGECLICGYITADRDYNAAKHMEIHVSSNVSYPCYRCDCCSEKFFSPRSLYMHKLSRDKACDYECDICSLKFKRKHYLMCHNFKQH